jgi:hypothetical protein
MSTLFLVGQHRSSHRLDGISVYAYFVYDVHSELDEFPGTRMNFFFFDLYPLAMAKNSTMSAATFLHYLKRHELIHLLFCSFPYKNLVLFIF